MNRDGWTFEGPSAEALVAAEQAAYMRKVYLVMALGLLATGATAQAVASSEALSSIILGNRFVYYGLCIAEFLMVLGFASIAERVSAFGAAALFFLFAVVNGLTLSVIFLVYTSASIASTFFITAGTFAVMSGWGFVTKRDLTGLGHFAFMGLIGVVLASLVNIFLRSSMLEWVTSCVGVVVFTSLVAYDTQKIKRLNVIGNAGTDEDHKEAIHGALVLYLDFINLFLNLLRLFGRRR